MRQPCDTPGRQSFWRKLADTWHLQISIFAGLRSFCRLTPGYFFVSLVQMHYMPILKLRTISKGVWTTMGEIKNQDIKKHRRYRCDNPTELEKSHSSVCVEQIFEQEDTGCLHSSLGYMKGLIFQLHQHRQTSEMWTECDVARIGMHSGSTASNVRPEKS